jgi:hypothetical protein
VFVRVQLLAIRDVEPDCVEPSDADGLCELTKRFCNTFERELNSCSVDLLNVQVGYPGAGFGNGLSAAYSISMCGLVDSSDGRFLQLAGFTAPRVGDGNFRVGGFAAGGSAAGRVDF